MRKRDIVRKLKRAKQLLLDNGWVQGSFERDGAFCMMGALKEIDAEDDTVLTALATTIKKAPKRLSKKAAMKLAKDCGCNNPSIHDNSEDWQADAIIVNYNDTTGRRKQDVLRKFDKAISLLGG